MNAPDRMLVFVLTTTLREMSDLEFVHTLAVHGGGLPFPPVEQNVVVENGTSTVCDRVFLPVPAPLGSSESSEAAGHRVVGMYACENLFPSPVCRLISETDAYGGE